MSFGNLLDLLKPPEEKAKKPKASKISFDNAGNIVSKDKSKSYTQGLEIGLGAANIAAKATAQKKKIQDVAKQVQTPKGNVFIDKETKQVVGTKKAQEDFAENVLPSKTKQFLGASNKAFDEGFNKVNEYYNSLQGRGFSAEEIDAARQAELEGLQKQKADFLAQSQQQIGQVLGNTQADKASMSRAVSKMNIAQGKGTFADKINALPGVAGAMQRTGDTALTAANLPAAAAAGIEKFAGETLQLPQAGMQALQQYNQQTPLNIGTVIPKAYAGLVANPISRRAADIAAAIGRPIEQRGELVSGNVQQALEGNTWGQNTAGFVEGVAPYLLPGAQVRGAQTLAAKLGAKVVPQALAKRAPQALKYLAKAGITEGIEDSAVNALQSANTLKEAIQNGEMTFQEAVQRFPQEMAINFGTDVLGAGILKGVGKGVAKGVGNIKGKIDARNELIQRGRKIQGGQVRTQEARDLENLQAEERAAIDDYFQQAQLRQAEEIAASQRPLARQQSKLQSELNKAKKEATQLTPEQKVERAAIERNIKKTKDVKYLTTFQDAVYKSGDQKLINKYENRKAQIIQDREMISQKRADLSASREAKLLEKQELEDVKGYQQEISKAARRSNIDDAQNSLVNLQAKLEDVRLTDKQRTYLNNRIADSKKQLAQRKELQEVKVDKYSDTEISKDLSRQYEETFSKESEISEAPLRDGLERLGFEIRTNKKGTKYAQLGNVRLKLDAAQTIGGLPAEARSKIAKQLAKQDAIAGTSRLDDIIQDKAEFNAGKQTELDLEAQEQEFVDSIRNAKSVKELEEIANKQPDLFDYDEQGRPSKYLREYEAREAKLSEGGTVKESLTVEAPKKAQPTEPPKSSEIKTPKNQDELEDTYKKVFKLEEPKAKAAAVVTDRIFDQIARRKGITKAQAYSEVGFKKSNISEVGKGAKFQSESNEVDFKGFHKTKGGSVEEPIDSPLWFSGQGKATSLKDVADYKDSIYLTKKSDFAKGYGNVLNVRTPDKFKRLDLSNQADKTNFLNTLYKDYLDGNTSQFNDLEQYLDEILEKNAKKYDDLPEQEFDKKVLEDLERSFDVEHVEDSSDWDMKGVQDYTRDKGFDLVQFKRGDTAIALKIPDENIKFQSQKGAMETLESGKKVIHALTDPNVSTPLHEIAHVYEEVLTKSERTKILDWAGSKEWDTNASEKFARGFERYLADGKAPIPELKQIFEDFKDWLTDIYKGITGSDIDLQLNKEMRKIYDEMLGKAEEPKLKERKFAETVKQSENVAPEVKKKLEEKDFTYEVRKNKELVESAKARIEEKGIDKAEADLLKKNKEDFTDDDIAEGIEIAKRYQEAGDVESAVKVFEDLVEAGTAKGRAVQAFRTLNLYENMSPETALYAATKRAKKARMKGRNAKIQEKADMVSNELKEGVKRIIRKKAKEFIDELDDFCGF